MVQPVEEFKRLKNEEVKVQNWGACAVKSRVGLEPAE